MAITHPQSFTVKDSNITINQRGAKIYAKIKVGRGTIIEMQSSGMDDPLLQDATISGCKITANMFGGRVIGSIFQNATISGCNIFIKMQGHGRMTNPFQNATVNDCKTSLNIRDRIYLNNCIDIPNFVNIRGGITMGGSRPRGRKSKGKGKGKGQGNDEIEEGRTEKA